MEARVDKADSGGEDDDAVEVAGEPVSRGEARRLGFSQFDVTWDAKGATAVFRLDQLPSDISGDLSAKLERAWQFLKRNEIDEAFTLAHEVVWEYPSLVAAKVIISRCLINRKEYGKALNILQAVPDFDRNAEVLYYIALSKSRQGKIREALDALKQARSLPAEILIRKRISDLLAHLQGERTACPSCGKQVAYDAMVDAGDQTLCAECAGSLPDAGAARAARDERAAETADAAPQPPFNAHIWLLLAALLAGAILLGLNILAVVSPERYAEARSRLPAGWTFLPHPGGTE